MIVKYCIVIIILPKSKFDKKDYIVNLYTVIQ